MAPPAYLAMICGLGGALLVAALLGHGDVARVLGGGLIGGTIVAAIPRRDRPEPEPARTTLGVAPDPALDVAFDAIDDPLLLIDGGGVTRANSAARRLLGEHVVGEDFRVAIRHPAAAQQVERAQPGKPTRLQLDAIGSDARRFELQATALGGDRRLVRLADRATAEVAEKMRTDFVANASHELRTPLATLIGFIETLEDMNDAEATATRARFLSIMMGEARRMAQLVEDLVSLSRIEGERFSAPGTAIALAPLIAEVRDAILDAGQLPPERIVVRESIRTSVLGDRGQLAQVLHNLVGNALKYGRAETPVTIALDPASGQRIAISVTDQGDGIAAEHLPRLTERFYRVDPGRSRALGGTGLGLAIVKHIVERHRGRLAIDSRQGIGTTVTVILPIAQGAA